MLKLIGFKDKTYVVAIFIAKMGFSLILSYFSSVFI